MKRTFDEETLPLEIVCNCGVYTEEGDSYKGAQSITTIIEEDGKFYKVEWWSHESSGEAGIDNYELDEVELIRTEKIVTEKQIWDVVKEK